MFGLKYSTRFTTYLKQSNHLLNLFSHISKDTCLVHSKIRYFSHNMGLPLCDVIKRLQELAPLKLAEGWDNVGLLVEPTSNTIINTALLTIDLTEDVVEEAIENKAGLIISYHPNIFKPLKRVTQSHWKERIISKCIRSDIAVFSPHTSWDAVENGVNDWLASAFNLRFSKPIVENSDDPTGKSGVGRIITMAAPSPLNKIIEDVKKHIGIPHLRVGLAKHQDMDTIISSIAVCAGSGGSVLNGVKADLYLTGEMLHHDVLEATQNGINVILCNHSDSERGYLKNFQQKIQCQSLKVIVSKVDRDCLVTV
nr:NIF3-like protein 1 isoform X1 [Leptinotarsa decemlineata]